LQIPERVKKLKGQIQALNEGIGKLTSVLDRLIDVEGKPTVDQDQKGLDSYVS
jgi:phage-related minor tail protein